MNKKITIAVGLVVILGALFLYGRQASTQNPSGNQNSNENRVAGSTVFVPEESFYDFGDISMAHGDVTHEFAVKNAGDQPITIKKIYTSCMCTTAYLKMGDEKMGPFGMPGHGISRAIHTEIHPGELVSVETVFDPAAHGPSGVGLIQRSVFVETESQGMLELQFKATVTP